MFAFVQKESVQCFLATTKTKIKDSEMTQTSIVVAYYLLLSLFPLLIAVGNVLPYLNINPNTVLPYVQEVIPPSVYEFLSPAILDLLTQGSGGALSISALITLWSASASMNALQMAFFKAYGVSKRGNFIIMRIFSILTMLALLLGVIGMTLVVGAGKLILDKLQPIFLIPDQAIETFQTLKWPLTITMLFILMLVIYTIIPNVKLHLRSIVPGAIFATAGWMALSQAFGIYAKFFANRISGYQIIGSFIVLMIWLNFAAMILVLGGIINAIIEESVAGTIEERNAASRILFKKINEKIRMKERS